MNYQRTIEELREHASMFWPEDISAREAELSVIPLLLQTQDEFLAILAVRVDDLDKFFDLIDTASLPANLFVKHLAVLADVGGEMLKRFSSQFSDLFPSGELTYAWLGNGSTQISSYKFKMLPARSMSNDSLGLTGKKLIVRQELTDLHKDAIAILLFGSSALSVNTAATLGNCQIGEFLGRKRELEEFVRHRYIFVSRITGGAKANSLGHLAQEFVFRNLRDHLGANTQLRKDATIPGIGHTGREDRRGTTFDIVVSRGGKYVAIEVAFQVTTNSVIERKAGQALARQAQLHESGHRIAYVVDGAGNFERVSALSNILDHSDCSVAFSPSELEVLCMFIDQFLEGRIST